MTLQSPLLFPPPSRDPRIQLAYNDGGRPLAFGEAQSRGDFRQFYEATRARYDGVILERLRLTAPLSSVAA